MRTLPLWVLLLVLPSFAVAPGRAPAQAQDVGAQISFVNRRPFLIPFDPVPTPPPGKPPRVYVSRDQGKHWDPFAVAPPDQVPPKFHFIAEADGLYWFAVQTETHSGGLFPPSMDRAQPSLKVIVDTIPPLVRLRALPARGGAVGVSWE